MRRRFREGFNPTDNFKRNKRVDTETACEVEREAARAAEAAKAASSLPPTKDGEDGAGTLGDEAPVTDANPKLSKKEASLIGDDDAAQDDQAKQEEVVL